MKVVREDIVAIIRNANVVAEPDALQENLRLADQGIDSLGVFNILLLIEEQYGIKIPDEEIDRLASIADIVEYLNQKLV